MNDDQIRVTCACGKRIKADRKFLGRETTCPACGMRLVVEPTSLSKPEPPQRPSLPPQPPINEVSVEQGIDSSHAPPNRRKYNVASDLWPKHKQPLTLADAARTENPKQPFTEADLGLKPTPKPREPFNTGLLVLRVYGALCFLIAVGYFFASNRPFGGEFTQAKDGLIGMLWLTQFTIAGAADVIVTSSSRRRAT